ncbi:hypothetical protein ACFVVM_32365 [Nocardia sp. NPDC058176]|uniref:hypothetical protein n=1 Tax=Nocardia sp. NPDC058176 TaxID=3346368 RepID=UPI0036DC09DF
MSSMNRYSRLLPDADRAPSPAEQAAIDRSIRPVTDTRLRRAVFRISGGSMPWDEVILFGAPSPGVILKVGRRDRIMVVSSEVETWDQDRVDDETLAPDGEPDAGEFVWVTGVTVAATEAENAADDRDDERAARDRRREHLEARIRNLISGPVADREYPAADDPALARFGNLTVVPRRDRNFDGAIRIDPVNRQLWLQEYNGRDGDDWSVNNVPAWRVWRMPLTEERAALVADLRTEYELENWLEGGYDAETAAVFIAAGWSAIDKPMYMTGIRVGTPDEARELLARTPEQWRELGWDPYHGSYGPRFSPADAVRLGEAGITCHDAADRARSGHHSVEDILAARAPQIPATATRIHLVSKRSAWGTPFITDDPAAAQAYLDTHADEWDCLVVADDARILHADSTWSVCETTSGALELIAAHWHGDTARPDAGLSEPARDALTRLAAADHNKGLLADPALWSPVLTATHHHAERVDHYEHDSHRWSAEHTITRHQYTLANGTTLTWWQLDISEGGMVGGEGESYERTTLHTSHDSAKTAYLKARDEL